MYGLLGRIPVVANANSTLGLTLNQYYKNLIFKMKSKSLEGFKAMMQHLYEEINCFFPQLEPARKQHPSKTIVIKQFYLHSSLLSLLLPQCVYICFVHEYIYTYNQFFFVSMNNALHNVISYFFTVEFIPSLFALSAIDIEINHVITKTCHYNTIIMFGYLFIYFFFQF